MSEESLFVAALKASGTDARRRLLDEECQDNPALRQRVERLLANHDRACGILDRNEGRFLTPGNGSSGIDSRKEYIGKTVGPYRLTELLGEGGFGLVFSAEQQSPLHRTVALKIIRPGMDSREILARFDRERSALALMDHPNIARVLDAGTTENGHPYFVMERVHGEPITTYADQKHLGIPERLQLFLHVCQAVQHAHQKGIIHRDLKPTNILVAEHDGQPTVKVIDFGIAKALQQQPGDSSFYTCTAQMLGTPSYMSPEQVEMNHDDIDTRTDIYSLGVLLYELLTGTTPFERERLESAGFDEWRRIIREEEPVLPSSRITTLCMEATTVSTNRRSEARQLSRLCKGELDWIAMKALDKDRSRRYATAIDLARDVEHYLHHEPVDASPPSSLYRLRKMLRRHRAAVLITLLIMFLLIAGIIGTSIGLLQAKQAQLNEEQRAEQEKLQRQRAERAELEARHQANEAKKTSAVASALVQFLRKDLLGQAGSITQLGSQQRPNPQLTVREALDRAYARLGDRFKQEPDVEAAILSTMGASYRQLGQYEKAASLFQQSLKLRNNETDQDREEVLQTQNQLALVLRELGRTKEAIVLHEKVRDAYSRLLGPEHPYTLTAQDNLAVAFRDAGRRTEAMKLLEQVREARTRVLGAEDPATLVTYHNIATMHMEEGNNIKAIAELETICEAKKRVLGSDHLDTLPSISNLATAYWKTRQLAKSIPLFESVLGAQRNQLGNTHPATIGTLANLGVNYRDAGRLDEAITLLKQALESSKQQAVQLWVSNELLLAYIKAGMKPETVRMIHKNLSLHEVKTNQTSLEYAAVLANHAATLMGMKEWAEAESMLRKCLAIRQTKAPDNWLTFHTQSQLGGCLFSQKQYVEAETLLLQGYRGLRNITPKQSEQQHSRLILAMDRLIQLYTEINKPDEVKKWQTEKESLSKLTGIK